MAVGKTNREESDNVGQIEAHPPADRRNGVTTASGDAFFNEVTFTGSVADASGLLYMNARYYNPSTARFLSQDTYTGSASVPWTQHLYAYCNNNPVNMVDPTGHAPVGPMRKNMVCINDGGSGETITVILYSSYNSTGHGGGEGDYSKQAAYYRDKSTSDRVIMKKVNTVAEFIEGWNSLPDEYIKDVYILSHGNGMSLIFQGGQGISGNGRNIRGQSIDAIGDLGTKRIWSLHLLSCNSGHTDLFDDVGTNAAAAFAQMQTIANVYAYDGSVSFGRPLTRAWTGDYEARLAILQHSYLDVYRNFGLSYDRIIGMRRGLYRYYWDGADVQYEKAG